jgi:hypothetical protein
MLRTCQFCGESFAVEKRQGRPPITCSDACRKARGREVKALGRKATHNTGTLDYRSGERHTTDQGDDQEALDALLSGSDDEDGRWGLAAEYVAQRDDSGAYRRDAAGRVITRFRNYFGEANAADSSEESVTAGTRNHVRVIGQRDLPHDWQVRADQGESVADLRMTEWLGLDLSVI